MKITQSMATLLLASSMALTQAHAEITIANHNGQCTSCTAKQHKIRTLEAQIAALKGDNTANSGALAETFTEHIPIEPASRAQTARASKPAISGKTYTVQDGDGLFKIARLTGCKASDIAAVNNMTLNSVIHPGQVIQLPVGAKINPPKAKLVATSHTPVTYTIKDGETYYSISRRLKIPLDDLMAANPKIAANRLYTGRVIKLPGNNEVAAPSEPATDTPPETPTEIASNETQETPRSAAEDITPNTETSQSDPEPLSSEPLSNELPAASHTKIQAVSVDQEISYGDFAQQHATTTERLNSLNDLNLTSATILAKGSELYVPAAVHSASN